MLNQDDLRAGILIGSVIVASWALDVAEIKGACRTKGTINTETVC